LRADTICLHGDAANALAFARGLAQAWSARGSNDKRWARRSIKREVSAVAMLLIRRAGILTTVQDLGRAGWGRFGVPASGAMDTLAARTANALVGNDLTAPVLELTGPGAALTMSLPDQPDDPHRLVAVAGADLDAVITDVAGRARALPVGRALRISDGETLTFPRRRAGARAILGVAGGLAVPRTFASAATDVTNQLGGWQGRPLRAGDALPIGKEPVSARRVTADDRVLAVLAAAYADPFVLRFIALPSASAKTASFSDATYRVTPRANRVGFRHLCCLADLLILAQQRHRGAGSNDSATPLPDRR
jgi:allophanate hydrolase subunit 2